MTYGRLSTVDRIHVFMESHSILYTFLVLSVQCLRVNIVGFHRFSDSLSSFVIYQMTGKITQQRRTRQAQLSDNVYIHRILVFRNEKTLRCLSVYSISSNRNIIVKIFMLIKRYRKTIIVVDILIASHQLWTSFYACFPRLKSKLLHE